MKTKILILFLAIAPVMARAQFTFTTNSGAITITGYNPAAGLNVVIPASTNGYPVTAIGASAFFDLTTITNVTIGTNVTSIGVDAFGYSGVTSVIISDRVTSIGDEAFADCSGLTGVAIPNSVSSIGEDAFVDCSLTSVTIGTNVTTIGDGAFGGCSGLTSVTIPNSVTTIGVEVFEGCTSLTNVTIPNSVTSIGNQAFEDCFDLTSITIPKSVTSIDGGAFWYCTGLTSVTIPNSVTNISEYAFLDCSDLHQAYFQGNAPLVDGAAGSADFTVFQDDSGAVYYYAGTTGWGATYGGWPTVELSAPSNPPQIGGSIGIQSGNFGFTITGGSNQTAVVEASTNLLNWQVIQTITLSSTSTNFTDAQWTNFPMRFYRAACAFTVGGTLTGLPAGDTVTLQDNGGDDLTLSTNGTFTFPTALPNGHAYSVTVSGTSGGTSILTAIYSPVTANGSGTISGANVMNVAIQCTPIYTGNLGEDMYNAAVLDGTANGGVPGVMLTENGGPFRVTAEGRYSDNVAEIYSGRCVFTYTVGTGSCSSTTFPSGTPVIQFGTVLECGFGPYGY